MPSRVDADASFDRYARMLRRTLDVPVALVSLVEEHRQVFPGASGLPEPWQSRRETPLTHSLCQYVVADRRPLVVADAREDPRLRDSAAIEDLGVVAYAGWPITDHRDQVIGSLCAIDSRPRRWTEEDLEGLADLAAACSAELSQRGLREQATRDVDRARRLGLRSNLLLALSQAFAGTSTLAEVASAIDEVCGAHLGAVRGGIWLRDDLDGIGQDAPCDRASRLERIPGSVPWPEATAYEVLPADEANPVGRVFTGRQAAYFRDRQDQDATFGSRHRSTASGEARALIPLGLGGQWFGVLVLVWSEELSFDEGLRTTLTAMAAYTSQAVSRARLLQERVEVSTTLQTAMLSELPAPEGLHVAARYRPAGRREQVGGDWYDALVLPSGATALVVGDVVGHDIVAASVMGKLRNTLRAFTWAFDETPARHLARLDGAQSLLGCDALATVVLARVEPAEPDGAGRRTVRWSNAGHPPPLLVDPRGRVSWLEEDPGPDLMLGVDPDTQRVDHCVVLEPGSTLLLYTDGLVERRGEDLRLGLARLEATAAQHHDLCPEGMLDAILSALVGHDLRDDVAVLAVRSEIAGPVVLASPSPSPSP